MPPARHLFGVARTSANAKTPAPHDRQRCKKIFALLSEYLDRKLPAGNCTEIEKHMNGCAPCRAFLQSLERSVALCRGYRGDRLNPRAAARTRRLLLAACRRARVLKSNPS